MPANPHSSAYRRVKAALLAGVLAFALLWHGITPVYATPVTINNDALLAVLKEAGASVDETNKTVDSTELAKITTLSFSNYSSPTAPTSAEFISIMDYMSSLRTLDLTSSRITEVGAWFTGGAKHSLQSVTIPNGVTSIANSAFEGCSNLTTLSLPSSLRTIGNSAFADCIGLTSLPVSYGVSDIGKQAFSGCTNIKGDSNGILALPNTIKRLGESCFASTNIEILELPSSIAVAYDIRGAFKGMNNTQIVDLSSTYVSRAAGENSTSGIGEVGINSTVIYGPRIDLPKRLTLTVNQARGIRPDDLPANTTMALKAGDPTPKTCNYTATTALLTAKSVGTEKLVFQYSVTSTGGSTTLYTGYMIVTVTAAPTATPVPTATPRPSATPTPTPAPTPTLKPGQTPLPTPTLKPGQTPVPTPTLAPGQTPYPTASPTPSPTAFVIPYPAKTYATVGSGTLNFRQYPNTGARIQAILKHGAKLECIERIGPWVKVKTSSGQTGYVAWTNIGRSANELMIGYSAQVLSGTLNFRESPNSSAKVLSVLKNGQKIVIEDNKSNKVWTKIVLNGRIGYVAASYIGAPL